MGRARTVRKVSGNVAEAAEAIWVRLPVTPKAARTLRKHADALGKLYELLTQVGTTATEIVSHAVQTADELEQDVRKFRRPRARRR
jgi:hypothetical protein